MKEKCCFKNEKVKRSGTSYQVLDTGGVTGQGNRCCWVSDKNASMAHE
jgi:hypothetical protein